MQKAITTMNGSELKGRSLRVKRAIEKSRMEKKVRKIINKKRGKGLINSEPSKTIDNIQNETQTPV